MCKRSLLLWSIQLVPEWETGKPGFILTHDPNNRGATNMTVFEREKKCLVRLGATPTDASADRFLNATAAMRGDPLSVTGEH